MAKQYIVLFQNKATNKQNPTNKSNSLSDETSGT